MGGLFNMEDKNKEVKQLLLTTIFAIMFWLIYGSISQYAIIKDIINTICVLVISIIIGFCLAKWFIK